jgi:superfamily II DNA or RNA helicase
MAVASSPQISSAMGDSPRDVAEWSKVLFDAFTDRQRTTGFLQLAQRAERACPGDPLILGLAATAALLDDNPQQALVFLKRYHKRYIANDTYYLLYALALAQQAKLEAANAVLERNELIFPDRIFLAFPGGRERIDWLSNWLDRIFFHEVVPKGTSRQTARGASKAPASPTVTLPSPIPQHSMGRTGGGRAKGSAGEHGSESPSSISPLTNEIAGAIPAVTDGLPRIDVDIPNTFEIDLAPLLAAIKGQPETDGGWYQLRERFTHLSLVQGFDELLCLPRLRGIEIFRYQVETARKVLKQFRGRVLLADEVGLGKTIEAGMVMKEYLLRGMVESVLVLTPASLVGQWHEELESKFEIDCATTHDALLRSNPEQFWAQKRVIASLALARRREHAQQLLNRSFDLVVVDEAHHLRDRNSQTYKLVNGLNKRFLLLLSATPVQNDLTELYNILTLLKPGIFKTLKEFRAAHVISRNPRQPANPEQLRDLMRGAMVRNTRAVVALTLPLRHATTIRVDESEGERRAYEDLTAAVRRLAANGGAGRLRLAFHHLLGAAGSSPAAASAALMRFRERHADQPEWQTMGKRWAAIGTGAKETALLELLRRNPAEKKLVFVHYLDTLEHLAGLLAGAGVAFVRFDGSLSGPEKDAAINEFRDHVPVLLSTESGGEGRNIQFCNTLINFDIPWNPMAIEQRIGRIDRIGQQREVFVFNLVTRGTIEEQILHLLDEKINMFELVVGEVGAILGGIEEDRDFSEMVLNAWLETTEASRKEAFDALGQRLDQALQEYKRAKSLDEALFGEDFETG